MVLRRLPTLVELRDNPSLMDRLTPPQMQALLDWIKEQRRGMSFGGVIPPSPGEMAENFAGDEWQMAPHLEVLNAGIVQLVNGEHAEGQGAFKILLVSMPPQYGKSELCSKWTPAWYLATYPKRRVILASYGDDFAATWGGKTREVVNKFGDKVGIALDRKSTAAAEWALISGGGMKTVGAGSGLAGRPAELFIIDDPHAGPDDARSEVYQEKVWAWFTTVAYPRLQPGGVMIVISTRWHERDLYGRIKEVATKDKTSAFYGKVAEIRFPALAEENDPLDREIGEPLWPARYSLEEVMERKALASGYDWSAVYQQRPTPEQGNRVLRSWIQYYDVLPTDFDIMLQSWDMSLKDKKRNDPVAGGIWGVKAADVYLIDQKLARMDMPTSCNAVRAMTKQYPQALLKLIEDKANGPAVIQTLQHEIPGITAWPPPGQKMTSKEQRLDAVTPLFSAMNIWLPRPDRHPWVKDYVEELVAFPNGANDDQVDQTTQALDYIKRVVWNNQSRILYLAKQPAAMKSTQEIFEAEMWKVHEKKLAEGVQRLQNGRIGDLFKAQRIRSW